MTVGTTIALPIIAPTTQPASWVFGHFETLYDVTFVPNGVSELSALPPPFSSPPLPQSQVASHS